MNKNVERLYDRIEFSGDTAIVSFEGEKRRSRLGSDTLIINGNDRANFILTRAVYLK